MWKDLQRWKKQSDGRITVSLNTRLVWALVAALAAVDAAGLGASGLSLADGTLPPVFLAVFGLLALAYVYTYIRRDARVAALAHTGAAVLAFTAVSSILSYISVTWGAPLIDPQLAAADQALGLDWPAMYHWVSDRKALHFALILAYWSPVGQLILLLVVLNFLGRISRCWETLWLFMLTVTGCILVSGLWPATGAFGYFHIRDDEPYVRAFLALRDGSLKVISKNAMEGVIQFPSLHVAWAIIYTYAARGVKVLFPLLCVVNALVFLAIPAVGGHHFADMWGGIVLTLAALVVVRKMAFSGFLPSDIAKKNETVKA